MAGEPELASLAAVLEQILGGTLNLPRRRLFAVSGSAVGDASALPPARVRAPA